MVAFVCLCPGTLYASFLDVWSRNQDTWINVTAVVFYGVLQVALAHLNHSVAALCLLALLLLCFAALFFFITHPRSTSAAQCECGVIGNVLWGGFKDRSASRREDAKARRGVNFLVCKAERRGGVYQRITNPENLPTTCQQKEHPIHQPASLFVPVSFLSPPSSRTDGRERGGDLGDGTSQVPCQCNARTRTHAPDQTHTRTHRQGNKCGQICVPVSTRLQFGTGFGNGIKDAASLLQTLFSKPLSQMGQRQCDTGSRELGVRLDG